MKCSEGFRGFFKVFPLVLLMILSFVPAAEGVRMEKGIRKSVIAGSWYPGEPGTLTADIREYLRKAPAEGVGGNVVALISPHAGYVYSGQIAAHGYRLLQGQRFDSVIVVGPSHRVHFRGASVYNTGGYETPLGVVSVDTALADRILGQGGRLSFFPQAHLQEHSVEIQLPFLQVVLGNFKFVPIVMADQDRGACEELAEAIFKSTRGKKVLLVASSDLSHFHGYEQAVKLDRRAVDSIGRMDVDGLARDLESGACEACGGGPMMVALLLAKKMGASGAKVLQYANSGDVTGDRSRVVGYLSAALYQKQAKTGKTAKPTGFDAGLAEGDKTRLVERARKAIECRLDGKPLAVDPSMDSPVMQERRGAFVSLKKNGKLRGCIGYIEAKKPLCQAIDEMAVAAAFNDPRFPPLKREELQDLDIEISVLTPLRKINHIEEIQVGKHGLYVVRGYYSGLLLPQVATEYRWDRLTFLQETCYKAGLPADAWKDKKTDIYVFSADIFGSRP